MSSSICICLFSFTFLFIFPLCRTSFSLPGNVSDHQSLLSLKANMIGDPLRSWNESTHFCNWVGITCGRKHKRVVKIKLESSNLGGSLSPAIGNLSFLRELLLFNNSLTGIIPKEIGRLRRLNVFDLERNILSGEIPKNFSHCDKLVALSLGNNNLMGTFPLEFQPLSQLEYLLVFENHLIGEIPAYIGNFSSLIRLSFGENNFKGKIPTSLGCLQKLNLLSLHINYLTSTIPISIFNLSSMVAFDVQINQLEGYLPSNLGSTLPNIKYFYIGDNLLTGQLPISIANATRLGFFYVRQNNFIGGVPSFSGLKRLKWFSLHDNPLGNGKSTDLNFLASLLNSTARLQTLYLGNCNFGGVLPRLIANFSQLHDFQIENNFIGGYIPSEIHLLVNLEQLDLSKNQLGGTIPSSWGSLQQLIGLYLDGNKLFGEIPFALGNLSFLSQLYLGFNELQGKIPISLGKSKNLLELDLSGNKLQGNLPKVLFNSLSSLVYLDLSHNSFTGPLPLELGELKILVSLNLSKNMFSGTLPSTLGTVSSLTELNISHNLFHGFIPPSFTSLKSLEILDLSSNNLTGEIPEFLGKLEYLKRLNLSSNHFEGELPTQGIFKNETEVELGGNTNLCGGIPQFGLPKCTREGKRQHLSRTQKLAILISSGGILFLIVVGLVVAVIYKRKPKLLSSTWNATMEAIPKLSYWSIQRATNGFSESNIIGSGKFSTVYKGILDDSLTVVAIKVLKLHVRGASKSFLAECEALRQIRHRNLVKVLTSCCSIDHEGNDFKAIVYEYMINGSLDNWLHNHSANTTESRDSKVLNVLQRVNIVIDVANALDYLHSQMETLLVHCDLKPSNILLDGDLVAHVGDFGLAKFLPFEPTHASSSDQMSSAGIKGTIGYTAPEYGMGSALSTFGDMYSYGILLLEIFTGKSPTSDIFNSGLTLHNYVKMAVPEQVVAIIDPKLFHQEVDATSRNLVRRDRFLECFVSIFKVGIACSVESPRERMNIGCAIKQLHSIKDNLMELGDCVSIPC